MTKLGSQKSHICPKVTKVGSIIGRRIDYNGVGALRGQQHIPSKNLPNLPNFPSPPPGGGLHVLQVSAHSTVEYSELALALWVSPARN